MTYLDDETKLTIIFKYNKLYSITKPNQLFELIGIMQSFLELYL